MILTIAGIPIRILTQPTADGLKARIVIEGGELSSSLSGAQGGAIRWQRHEWTLMAARMTDAERAALVNQLLPPGKFLPLAGEVADVLAGGPFSASVEVTEEIAERVATGAGTGHKWSLTLRIRE